MYWPVRATARSVDSALYSFLRLNTLKHFSGEREDTPSKEEDLAETQGEPVVRRQADLIPPGPEHERGAVRSQESAARHAAAVAPLRTKRERPRKTKRPDRVFTCASLLLFDERPRLRISSRVCRYVRGVTRL